ncbi:regulator of replication initiation timing [Paenibacillus rhizosphaerae]|uniref:Regulator of replication initiation timing n=1 Tax=Paenibacillus rhizosphaerae TaxID=297318 RepID=A0A839U334_9BACL|nr:DUF4062 domain-containing protein [Paenibacillus rhizosphaerae]MBB3132140.1 regulator of replication initiation timing [Paenibacillus rhizosphaerae]
MKKKLQIFVSSTYTDLIPERQTAVKAILNAGHIPAGMELFTAGDESQQDIIKRWIEESDAYMLILGGRYGSMLPDGSKSYTHWEYDYAGEIGKPRFAVVLSDKSLQSKIEEIGFQNVQELTHPQKYKDFRDGLFSSKLVSAIDDSRDIELSIFKSLREIERREDLSGWVSGKDVPNVVTYAEENMKLRKENDKLRDELQKVQDKLKIDETFNGLAYTELKGLLLKENVKLDSQLAEATGRKEINLLSLFITFENELATGVSNSRHTTETRIFLFYNVAPKLMRYGLMETYKATGIKYDQARTSKDGLKFLALFHSKKIKEK